MYMLLATLGTMIGMERRDIKYINPHRTMTIYALISTSTEVGAGESMNAMLQHLFWLPYELTGTRKSNEVL